MKEHSREICEETACPYSFASRIKSNSKPLMVQFYLQIMFSIIVAVSSDCFSVYSRVSASAMLTGKFLQIRKVLATYSLLPEGFLDNLENIRMLYKISNKNSIGDGGNSAL